MSHRGPVQRVSHSIALNIQNGLRQFEGNDHRLLIVDRNFQFDFFLQTGNSDLLQVLNHADVEAAHDLLHASDQQAARRLAEQVIAAFQKLVKGCHFHCHFLIHRQLFLIHIGIINQVANVDGFAFERTVQRSHEQRKLLLLLLRQSGRGGDTLLGHIPDFDGI